jgi:hypothetical protein
MGRTIPSWRIVVDEELAKIARFKQFLRAEDRVVFDDLITQCRLYSSSAGVLASSIREVPLLLSMVFAQHKKLMELEKRLKEVHSEVPLKSKDSRSLLHYGRMDIQEMRRLGSTKSKHDYAHKHA